MLEWKKIDDELFDLPNGARVAVYYKDVKYNKYNITSFVENLYFNKQSWKDVILNAYKDKEARCYCIINLPDIPAEYK